MTVGDIDTSRDQMGDRQDDSSSGIGALINRFLGDDDDGEETETEEVIELVHPTNPEVVETALDVVIRRRQQEKAAEMSPAEYDDPGQIRVELDVRDPHNLIAQTQREFANIHDELVEELDRLVALQENSVTGTDFDTLVYIIERNADVDGNTTILGGAESLLRNMANREGYSEDEKEFIVEAHTEAARRSGFDRHLLLDTIAFLPHTTAEDE